VSDASRGPIPTDIELHRKSRLLRIRFSDRRSSALPCEYLRAHAPAAELTCRRTPEAGRENVNIDQIVPQGHYAIRLVFDDGHDTGIYAWQTLYDLEINRERHWQIYLDGLARSGYDHSGAHLAGATPAGRNIRVLYFHYLASRLGRESGELTPPESVETVAQLLAWMRRLNGDHGSLPGDDSVRITVNRQFAKPFTRIDPGDELATVSNSPNPPPPGPRRSGDVG